MARDGASSAVCGLPAEQVAAFYAEFETTRRVVTVYSLGVNQSAQGTDTVNAILNVHFLTGREVGEHAALSAFENGWVGRGPSTSALWPI